MQQFQVPQFITVEDRIIGPLTLKQFMYLLGGAAVLLLGWFFLHVILFVLVALPLGALFTSMAFVTINGRPFPTVFANGINYYLKPHLYLWQKSKESKDKRIENRGQRVENRERGTRDLGLVTRTNAPIAGIPKLSESKLSDLAWSLDIKEKIDR